MATDPESAGPVDHMLDLFVYAPLGFALDARSLLPRLIDRGRGQVVLARTVGQFALRRGNSAAEAALTDVTSRATETLRSFGLIPSVSKTRNDDAKLSDDAGSAEESTDSSEGPDDLPTPHQAVESDSAPNDAGLAYPEVDPSTISIDASTLAIPDYDSLSASQVVPRLASLSVDELDAVWNYEIANRGRKTILNRITQLRTN